ncbi:MAG: hypothetical protein ACRD4Y_09805, partial [Candidatus Acidiferrales bacterium]
RYTPHVNEESNAEADEYRGSEFTVFDAIRFPLCSDASIPTSPPLVSADSETGGRMVLGGLNHAGDLRGARFDLDGAFRGTAFARMVPHQQELTPMRFQPSRNAAPGESRTTRTPSGDGLLHGTLSIRSGMERVSSPVAFLAKDGSATAHYRFDFDQDGSPEWVMENSRLRLIVSPAYSGRALAFVDKSTANDLITLGGGLHDLLIPAGAAPGDAAAGVDFAFNRGYRAEWTGESSNAGLRLSYQERENSPERLRVDKTVRFTKLETIETAYRVFLVVPSAESGKSGGEESFASELSVPVITSVEGNTSFCWGDAPASTMANGAASRASSSEASRCEDFVPGGAPIVLGGSIRRLEIRNPGERPLEVEWTAGRAIIFPGQFSARIRVAVHVPPSPEPPEEFTVRYTAGGGE